MTPDHIEALRKAAQQALDVQFLDQCKEEDGYFSCPLCGGEGSVDGVKLEVDAVFCAGVQVFGLGDEHVVLEKYLRMATPRTILYLLGEIDEYAKKSDYDEDEAFRGMAKLLAGAEARVRSLRTALEALLDEYWDRGTDRIHHVANSPWSIVEPKWRAAIATLAGFPPPATAAQKNEDGSPGL